MQVDVPLLKIKLENLISKYKTLQTLETDPICFPKRFQNPKDIEIVSLLSCLFAYGNVKNIQNFLNPIINSMGPSPYEYLYQNKENFPQFLESIKGYRFQTKEDVKTFLLTLQRIIQKNTNSTNLFESKFLDENGKFNSLTSLQNFQRFLEDEISKTLQGKPLTYGLQFLIGKWKSKSPKKRISLFLRWMVRKHYPDFGLYTLIKPNQIPYPMDVHIQKLSKILGIQNQRSYLLKDAFLLTEFFKQVCPDDPLLYDFYLTRVGIIEKCRGAYVFEVCEMCELREVCLVVPRGIEPRLQG
ncbi:TIGR02757 family protein [Leptospira sp. WS39.C2]